MTSTKPTEPNPSSATHRHDFGTRQAGTVQGGTRDHPGRRPAGRAHRPRRRHDEPTRRSHPVRRAVGSERAAACARRCCPVRGAAHAAGGCSGSACRLAATPCAAAVEAGGPGWDPGGRGGAEHDGRAAGHRSPHGPMLAVLGRGRHDLEPGRAVRSNASLMQPRSGGHAYAARALERQRVGERS
jgi:hypothetical protein